MSITAGFVAFATGVIAFGANLATFLLILSGTVIGALRSYSYRKFRDFILLGPLRRGIAQLPRCDVEHTRTHWDLPGRSKAMVRWSQSLPTWGRMRPIIVSWFDLKDGKRALYDRLKIPLLQAIDQIEIQPGEIFAEICAEYGLSSLYITAPVLAKIFSGIGHLPQPFLARILYPEDTQRLLQVGERAVRFLDRFIECKALEAQRQGSPITQPQSFGAFATALTGAIVLADAAEAKSRCAKMTLVWHSNTFRGSGYLPDATVERVSYDDIHPRAQGCRLWARQQDDKGRARPGDYDLCLLDLRSVTLAEAVTQGYVAFVIETAETCFAATEDGASLGCKRIVPASSTKRDDKSSWSATRSNGSFRIERELAGSRVALLDAYVAVISSDKKLLLTHRSKDVQHGQDVYSATAGGLIEPHGRGHQGDIDEFGAPDPSKTIARKAKDEIGAHLDPSICAPVCVFMCNIRGSSEDTRKSGQLVANILYIGYLPMKADDISDEIWSSSNHFLGRVGRQKLIKCDFNSSKAIASWSANNATKLDQHGVLSCLYACAMEYGYQETRSAFTNAFPEAPWWAMSPYNDNAVRLTRDPRVLVKGVDWLPNVGPVQWRSSWESMIF